MADVSVGFGEQFEWREALTREDIQAVERREHTARSALRAKRAKKY